MKLYSELFEDGARTKVPEIHERNNSRKGRDLDNWIEAEETVLAIHSEKMNQEDEDEAFGGMPFDGSDF